MKNKKTLYHFVLDKSGSMSNCIESTVNGYNAQLETIQKLQKEFPEQQFLVSLTIFDDIVDDVQLNQTIDAVEFLSTSRYRPGGTTALLDAIGMSINSIRIANESKILNNEMSIVMVILTDGLENASREFTFHQIAKTIKSLDDTEKWGKLYNWYAVNDPRGLAPEGWHVPSDNEWDLLADFLGGAEIAGDKMKMTNVWEGYDETNDDGEPTGEFRIDDATNESGFSAYPSGGNTYHGLCISSDDRCYWWSTSKDEDDDPMYRLIYATYSDLDKSGSTECRGASVRCLKD